MAQSTSDYKKFKLSGLNRKIQKKHVTNIARSMALYPDLFKIRPVLVTKDFEVIDGQHRLKAAEKLGIPVWYEVNEKGSLDDAIILNQNQVNWKLEDYARAYANRGISEYKTYLDILDEYTISATLAVLAFSGSMRTDTLGSFRQGKFAIPDLAASMALIEMFEEYMDINKGFNRTMAGRNVLRIMKRPEYDHERMINKLKTQADTISYFGDDKTILRDLEDVYNWHSPSRTRLY